MILVTFYCSGCNESAKGKAPLSRNFIRLWDRSNFGCWGPYKVKEIAPEGWMIGDPYTDCVYCSKCWEEIETSVPEKEMAKEPK